MTSTPASTASPSRRSIRVLFVEDSPKDVKLMIGMLKEAGYTPDFKAVDRPEALEEQLATAEPDVIISDYNLRGWTAIDALNILKKSGKDIPIIVVSGSLGDEAAVECIKQGAVDYVLKDRMARLPSAIEHAVENRESLQKKKAAQAALLESEERYRLLFQANPQPTVVYDADTLHFLAVNEAAIRQYGYSLGEFLAMTIADIRPAEDLPRLRQAVEARKKSGNEQGATEFGIWRHRKKDGTLVDVDISTHRLHFAGRDAILAVGTDVTEKILLEQQFRQAQKMEAVGRLAGGVAHDFNNLLGIVLGYADLLTLDESLSTQAKKRLEEIRKAAQRAAAVTRQLLAFSRKQVLETRNIDLNALIKQATGMLQRLLGEDVALVTELAPKLALVHADPTQIEQIILNLAVNSRDAMPNGGELGIYTSTVELDDAYGERHMHVPAGEYVLLQVSDNGCGMDADTQKQIFEPFFTTKASDRGTGLGLSTVYGIVKQSGGYIWVYSEVGVGTTFKIYLPKVHGVHEAWVLSARQQAIERGSETILLVEDDTALRELNRELLEEMGYVVLGASRGSEAITVAGRHETTIDILVTDVIMPGMNGKDLAEELLKSRPKMKVLFTSGYTDNIIRQAISSAGVAFLQKPFTRETLAKKLREVLLSKP